MYHRTALNTVRLRVVGVDSKRVETRNFASLQSFREVNYLIRTVLGRVSCGNVKNSPKHVCLAKKGRGQLC